MIDRLRSRWSGLPIPFGQSYALRHSSAVRLRSEHGARLRRYADYRAFYDGEHFDARAKGRTQLVLNYARAVVDKSVSYLFGRGVGLRSEDAAAQELLWDLLAGDLRLQLLQAATNAGVCGDAALRCYWTGERARIVNADPAMVFPTFSGEDPALLLEAAVVVTLRPGEARARFGIDGTQDVEVVELWTPETLRIEDSGGGVLWEAANPYGFVPIIWIRNMAPPTSAFGQSDLVDLIPVNRELDLRMSDFSDTVRFHADPPILVKGINERDQNLVGAPGQVWDMPADAEVKLLEWTGEAPAVGEHLERLLETIFRLGESPRSSFGDVKLQLSGVALELELAPLVQRTLRKRVIWELALRAAAGAAIALTNRYARAAMDPRVRVEWPPMLPRDVDAEATREINLVAAGIHSHRTAMAIVDVEDPEAELERVFADREKLQLLGDMATPAERQGAAVREGRPRGGATV